MTPPDPVEEKLREMVAAALSEVRSIGPGAKHLELDFRAAGVPALLADTQSKDKRIAELEGENARLRKTLEWSYRMGLRLGEPAWDLEGVGLVGRRIAERTRAALAGTGVASDGGDDGE